MGILAVHMVRDDDDLDDVGIDVFARFRCKGSA